MKPASKILFGAALAVGLMHGIGGAVNAEVVATNFTNPAFFGQPNTTYQFWNGFATASGPNAPVEITNPAAGVDNVADAYDASGAPVDSTHIFLFGSAPNLRIYSPFVKTFPTIVVPSFGDGTDWTTQIVLQTEISGTLIDMNSVTVTPLGGSAVPVGAADRTSVSSATPGRTDYTFVWSLAGSAASYTLRFNAGDDGTSMSWAGVRVDTLTSPAPEPASLATLGVGSGLLLMRRRRHLN